MPFGLSETTVRTIHAIFQQHPDIEQVIIYGSRAKGNYKPGSDIDLTLIGDALTHADLLRIMHEIVESPIPYLVDLSIFHDVGDLAVREHIQRRGCVFYQKLNP
ncbi:MAG: nucleotidyltransferase domain-containing protein [Firmicutes bacterium]|jgi:predicted nucleotidyltransferase|nr:nucleotidyltransferase domain-containing protein [Bacillota bacterium]MCL5064149.1 nucleotidyltransferase domain-containing protein [Bacillota bacterium]